MRKSLFKEAAVQAFASRDLMVSTLPQAEADESGVRVMDCDGCTDDTRCGDFLTNLFRTTDDRDYRKLQAQLSESS